MQFNVAPARHHLSKAIELYRGSDVTGELLALNNLATLELEVGRLDRVESALKAMEKVFEEPGIDPDECCYKLLRCELSLRREDYEETLRLADDLAAYASERGNRLLEGEGLRCKGLALRALARRTESVVAFEQAVDALSRSGAAESLVRAKLELVFADAIAGNDRTGGNAEDASLGMEDEEALTPSDLWSLAQALHSMGQYGRARGILQRAHAGFLSRLGRLASAADRSAYAAHPSHAELLRASASRTPWAAQRSQ